MNNVEDILRKIPEGVILVAAAKTRSSKEIEQVINAGVSVVGENYVQEAESAYAQIGKKASWHLIGHLQRNKAKRAVRIFDMIETLDSLRLGKKIDKECAKLSKIMPVLIEVNSGKEPQKYGVMPKRTVSLIKQLAQLDHLNIQGLMTMGPRVGDPEDARPYFQETKKLFDQLKSLEIPNTQMKYLSMGMSNSYEIAIDEGANMVRIGTRLFGKRDYE